MFKWYSEDLAIDTGGNLKKREIRDKSSIVEVGRAGRKRGGHHKEFIF